MKIALLTLSFPPQTGGVQRYLFELATRIAAVHEVVVISPVVIAAREPLRFRPIPSGRIDHFWQALRAEQPDKVIVGHAHPQLLGAAWLYRRNRYLTITYGNDYLAAQQRWHRPIFNALLRQSNPLITITQANAAKLQALNMPTPEIIYPGVDATQFVPAERAKDGNVMLSVGRLVPRKGVDTTLCAMPHIIEQFPDVQYRIVGDGAYRPRLEQLAHELGVADKITFLGRVSFAELLAQYHAASIFVMPVREEVAVGSMEGFGIVYLEASACGLPVIAGRSGGAVEAVRDGDGGVLVDPQDPQAVADAVITMFKSPQLATQMGRTGRDWVETEMSWERAAAKMLTILQT